MDIDDSIESFLDLDLDPCADSEASPNANIVVAPGGTSRYAAWIETYVSGHKGGYVRGKCAAATLAMVEAFPELRRQPGLVHVVWGREEHWWCVAPDGTIVDPTASQYPYGLIDYEPLDLNNPSDVARIPTGKCANCGGPIYNHFNNTVCSDACATAYRTYLDGGPL